MIHGANLTITNVRVLMANMICFRMEETVLSEVKVKIRML